MSDREKYSLEEKLQSKLQNHEVNASHLWENIAKQIPNSSGSIWNSLGKWAAGFVATAAVTGSLWFFLNQENVKVTESHLPVNQSNQPIQTTPKENTIQENSGASISINSDLLALDEIDSASTSVLNVDQILAEVEENSLVEDEARNFEPQVQQTEQSHSITQNQEVNSQDQSVTAHFSCVVSNPEQLRYYLFAAQDKADRYTWILSNGVESSLQAFPVNFEEPGEYSVSLTVEVNGVVLTENQVVNVYRPAKLQPANAFAPGYDGKNDSFDVLANSENVKELHSFTITNQTGRVVFESNSESSWNGRMNGELAIPGTYFWQLEYTDFGNEIKRAKGSIQLFSE